MKGIITGTLLKTTSNKITKIRTIRIFKLKGTICLSFWTSSPFRIKRKIENKKRKKHALLA
jgi:hypothetical protein